MIKGGEAEKCSVECHIHFTNQPLCTNFAEEPNCTSLNRLTGSGARGGVADTAAPRWIVFLKER